MMDKPASDQDDSQPQTTAPASLPDAVPDTDPAHVTLPEAPARSSSHSWGADATTDSSPAQSGNTVEAGDAASSLGERKVPSWFARNREQRTPETGDTGLPDKETSPATDWFSNGGNDSAFIPDFESDPTPATQDSPPVPEGTGGPKPTRSIVMVRRSDRRGFLPRIAHLLGASPSAISPNLLGGTIATSGVLTLIALLANSVGLALTILSAIVPLLMLASLVPLRHGQTSNASIMLAMATLNGVIVGGVIGWLAARLVAASWFDEGVLNFGAIGFGGHYAHAAGTPGWLIWLVCGVVIPIVALPASLIAPALAFRSGQFPDAANGKQQGAAAGAGFAIGTAAVYWAPLNVHEAPSFSTSDWTLMTIAVALLFPTIVVLGTMLVASGLWHLLRTNQVFPAVLAMTTGIAGFLVLRLGSLAIQPRQGHLWVEFAWTAVLAVGTIGLSRWVGTRPDLQD